MRVVCLQECPLTQIEGSIGVSVAAFALLVWLIRRDKVSLGLPVAYLFGLLLIHVPGALAHSLGGNAVGNSELTEIGIWFTAIGSVSFVAGVWLSRQPHLKHVEVQRSDRQRFWMFCLVGGWIFTYGLSSLGRIPSVGAAIEEGGAVWMLGVLLGLGAAFARRDLKWIFLWMGALSVYPVLMLARRIIQPASRSGE